MKAIRGIVLVCAILPGMAFAQLHVFSPLGNAVLEPFQVQPVIPDCMDLTQTQTVIHTGVNSATGQVHQAVCWDLVNDVIYIPNLWCNHQEGCGGGAVGITGTGTQNFVAKFLGPHVIEDASGFDDGTNPVTWPNGISTQDNGLYNTDPNSASPGTAVGLAACESTAGTLHTCLTSDKNNLAGVAEFGAGTTGSVEVCTTKCLATFDNTPVPGHWAILSPTVTGDFHDTGSTSPTGIFQQFVFVDSASPQTVKIMTPDVIGVANSIKNTIEFNEIASFPVADFNATTPAADSGFIPSTWKTSSAANTTSAIAEVPFATGSTKGVVQPDGTTVTISNGIISAAAGGLSNITGPPDVMTWSIAGGTATQGKQNETSSYFARGPFPGSSSTPFVRTIDACSFTSSTGTTCTLGSPSIAGDEIIVYWAADNVICGAITLTDSNSDTYSQVTNDCNHSGAQVWHIDNVPAGVTSITWSISVGATNGAIQVLKIGNVPTSAVIDASGNQGGAGAGCSGSGVVDGPTITTSHAGDYILGFFTSKFPGEVNSGLAPYITISTDNGGGRDFTIVGAQGPTATAYTPLGFCTGGTDLGLAVAVRGATSTNFGQWFFGPAVSGDFNAAGYPVLYNHTGVVQNTVPHVVIDTCVLGTSCSVTLTGTAIFTSATSFVCNAQDTTTALPTKVVISSGSAFAITGTGTDTIMYSCIGS